MAVRIVPARQVSPPPERGGWALQRGERRVAARILEWPHGLELVITLDAEVRWTRLFRGDAGELDVEAEHKREQLGAIRFTPVE